MLFVAVVKVIAVVVAVAVVLVVDIYIHTQRVTSLMQAQESMTMTTKKNTGHWIVDVQGETQVIMTNNALQRLRNAIH